MASAAEEEGLTVQAEAKATEEHQDNQRNANKSMAKKNTLRRPTQKELKPFWKALSIMERKFGEQVRELEDLLKETYGEHLMFFWCDGEIVGVGSEDRKMKLIHR